jgi:hypothetical protein
MHKAGKGGSDGCGMEWVVAMANAMNGNYGDAHDSI